MEEVLGGWPNYVSGAGGVNAVNAATYEQPKRFIASADANQGECSCCGGESIVHIESSNRLRKVEDRQDQPS